MTQGLPEASRFDYSRIKNWLFCWFPFALLMGNFELWVGASSLTVPLVVPLLVTVLVIDIAALRFRWSVRLIPFILFYIIFLTLGFLAGLTDYSTSIQRNLASLLPCISGLFVLLAFKDVDLPSQVSKVMVFAGALLALMVIARSLWVLVPVISEGREAVMESKGALLLPLGPSNFLAVFLMFFSMFAWRENKLVWLLLLVGVVFTLSRFGIAFTLVAALSITISRRIPISFFQLGFLLVSAAFVLSLFGGGGVLQHLASESILPASIAARLDLWFAGASIVTLNPLFPSSPGGFTSYLEHISWPRFEWGVHNFVLSIWIEFGLIGLLLFLCIIIFVLRSRSSMEARDEKLVKLAVIFLFLYASVENVVEVTSFQLLFAYLVCLLNSKRRAELATTPKCFNFVE